VAGLLTGQDLLAALKKSRSRAPVLVPDVMLRFDGKLFLDGMTLKGLQENLGREVIKAPSEARGFIRKLRLIKG
jgi:NifB/MoaA-like Fe-S oxidoreductase